MIKKIPVQRLPKTISCLLLLLLVTNFVWGHTINLDLEKAPSKDVVWFYFKLGIEHIVPFGIDHILFIAALYLLNNYLRTIFWQATAFTLAHSITLALSMKGIVSLPSEIVEPLIALSIVFVALENVLVSELKAWRILVVFMFGLIHGLGFASALNEIGIPRTNFFTSLISFNLGVEIGQVAVILFVFLLSGFFFGSKPWYKKRIVYPVSFSIALIALYWTIERMFI